MREQVKSWAGPSLNIVSWKFIVHLCAEVPHELPEGQSPKPINL